MGMSIDDHIEILKSYHNGFTGYAGCFQETIDVAIETMRKYQMFQADYEKRLREDMIAMLAELQMDIEECVDGGEGLPLFEQGVDIARCQVVDIIQQKINALKENSCGNNKGKD